MPTRYTHSEKTARDGLGGDPKSQVGTKFVPDFMYTPGMAFEGAFIDWLASQGAWISPKLAFKDYSEEGAGRGLVALEDFAKDEVLFKVPRKVLLSQKTASQRTDILRNASKAGWSRIMWSIVLERLQGDASFWKPYFGIQRSIVGCLKLSRYRACKVQSAHQLDRTGQGPPCRYRCP